MDSLSNLDFQIVPLRRFRRLGGAIIIEKQAGFNTLFFRED